MWRLIILASLMVFASASACAATCQDSFVKNGNPLGGLRFTVEVTVADLTPPTAIRQFRGIAAADGYDIIVDEADEGSMLIEQPRSPSGATRPIPIIVSAAAQGTATTVKLEAKMLGGMLAPAEGVKTELCKMLNQIKGGKLGLEAANRSKSAVSSAGPTVIEALMLSQQISQEADKNAAIIPSRYNGKSFTIKGTVDYVTRDGDTYRIAYVIPKSTNDLAIRFGSFKFLTQLSCLVAKGQSAYALTLKKGNHVTLTGRFRAYDQFVPVMWFDGCRPA